MCFQWPLHIISRPLATYGNSLQLKACPPLSCLTMDLPSTEMSLDSFCHDFDFVHTTSSPHFHQLNGFIESMVKKVKNAYKKTDGSPIAQARALLQLCDTPIMADLPSPAEILHGCPAQGTVLSRPSRKVNIHQICQRLVELQKKQKEQFDRAH